MSFFKKFFPFFTEKWKARSHPVKQQSDSPSTDQLSITQLKSLADFKDFSESQAGLLTKRSEIEEKLLTPSLDFKVKGFCYACANRSSFAVTPAYSYKYQGRLLPNWREQLRCQSCDFNNRMRASIHVYEHMLKPTADSAVFITEQVTPLFKYLKKRWPSIIGSEFLGNAVAQGSENQSGIRNENVTELSFQDAEFDYVMSFDVLEHVPHFTKALSEFSRILRPSGKLFLSVPFFYQEPGNLIRAVQNEDGTVEHLVEPEYHGDPLNNEGCLAYYTFGWELLEQIRAAGFSNATTLLYWSRDFVHLGSNQFFFIAEK